MKKKIKIEDIQKITLGVDDVLVVTIPDTASKDDINKIYEKTQDHFPNNKILVKTEVIKLSIIKVL